MQVNYSTTIPETIQRFDENRVTINFDVVKTKEAEGENPAEYQYKSILAPMDETKRKEALVVALLREQYSVNQELAANRERESDPTKFAAYNAFAEQCKTKANNVLNPPTPPTPPTSIVLDKTTISMAMFQTEQITASFVPEGSSETLNWTASESAVELEKVSNTVYKVKSVMGGTSVITVTGADSGKTATCTVYVAN